jgi:hypothetical protein
MTNHNDGNLYVIQKLTAKVTQSVNSNSTTTKKNQCVNFKLTAIIYIH